jgi:sugar transferase (PEP-CTERM system associated)
MLFRISNHYVSKIVSILLFVETLVFMASVYLGATIRFFDLNFPYFVKMENFFLTASVFALVMVFSMSAFGMYKHNYREDMRATFLRLMPSFAMGFGIITLAFYIVPDIYIGRGILGIVIVIAVFLILLVRTVFYQLFKLKYLESRIIFIGCGTLAKECSDLAMHNVSYHKYNIVGFVQLPGEVSRMLPSTILPAGNSLISLTNKYNANEVIVAVNNRRGESFPIQELLVCKLNGIKVTDAASFFEREACQIRVDSLQTSWLVFGGGFDQSFLRSFIKRIFDLFASTIILIVSFPVILITALCIYFEDRTPIFYQQERVGMDGHTFMVLKFRSMRNDAEQGMKPQWAAANDTRTTKVGRIIRKLRIDELPQILNVFKGEMSFVGPRPERPFFVKQLSDEVPYYNVRHSIKPGITGLAQVRYQYGASVEDSIQKLQYDLYYVKNNSLFLDVLILIDTFQVVIFGKGSR